MISSIKYQNRRGHVGVCRSAQPASEYGRRVDRQLPVDYIEQRNTRSSGSVSLSTALKVLLPEISYNSNPLVDVRTGARHADGRLGGLGSEHCLEGISAAETAMVLIST